jgi:hypothetical protein
LKTPGFLNNEFTLLNKKSDRYFLIITCLIFSVLFINIFVPFNINRWYSDSGLIQFLRLSSYGFVVGLVFLFTQFPLRRIFKIQNFTIKSYIPWLGLEIILISLVYIFMYGNPLGNFMNDIVFSLKYTLLGICLPYSFALLIIYYKNQRTEILQLKNKTNQPTEKHLISFKDEYGKIKFSLQATDLLLLESTDNYVSVYFLSGGKLQRKLVRNTLKNLENMLKDNAVIRCHRSFMVNTRNIELVQKKGKKLLVKIKEIEKNIPVSEKYSSLFIDFLS